MRVICGVQLKDRKMCKDLMLMLDLNKIINQLSISNTVHWDGRVLWREDGHVLRRALVF